MKHSDLPLVLGLQVLLDDDLVELASGRTQGRVRVPGHYTEPIGEQLVSIAPEQIAAVRIR